MNPYGSISNMQQEDTSLHMYVSICVCMYLCIYPSYFLYFHLLGSEKREYVKV